MSRLAIRAEVIKLAQVLDLNPERLEFLKAIPAGELKRFRAATNERLFDQDLRIFRRLAVLASVLPAWLTALLGRYLFGPVLTGRVASEMSARRAVRIALHLPPAFLATVCAELDPRRIRDIIQLFPIERIVSVAQALFERRDFMTISRFVEFLSDDAIRAVEQVLTDEAALLEIAFYMESKNRLDHLLHLLPSEKVREAILVVQDPARRELWPKVLALITHVSYALKHELGELAAGQGEAVLDALVNAIQEEDTWADVLPVLVCLSPDTQRKLANLPILKTPGLLERVFQDADQAEQWGAALSLLQLMSEALRGIVAQIAERLPRAAAERIVNAALLGEHWETLLELLARMSPAKQREFAEIARDYGAVDPELLLRIAGRAEAYGFGAQFAGMLPAAVSAETI
ncbi:MAG: hypothetical protein ACRETN_07050 [Nevskiales bacterium]